MEVSLHYLFAQKINEDNPVEKNRNGDGFIKLQIINKKASKGMS